MQRTPIQHKSYADFLNEMNFFDDVESYQGSKPHMQNQ